MSKKEAQQTQEIPLPKKQANESQTSPQPQGIEQIRDIIFGNTIGDIQGQIKDLGKQIAALEKSLHAFMGELEKSLSDVGEQWDNDMEGLQQRMESDQKKLTGNIQIARNQLLVLIDSIEKNGVPRALLAQKLTELGQSLKSASRGKVDATVSILGEDTM